MRLHSNFKQYFHSANMSLVRLCMRRAPLGWFCLIAVVFACFSPSVSKADSQPAVERFARAYGTGIEYFSSADEDCQTYLQRAAGSFPGAIYAGSELWINTTYNC